MNSLAQAEAQGRATCAWPSW